MPQFSNYDELKLWENLQMKNETKNVLKFSNVVQQKIQ